MTRFLSGMGVNWRYDPAAGIVFTQTNQESRPYTERLVLPSPTPHDLRSARGPTAIAPAYLDTAGISPQVTALARRITADAPTDFDKAVALNRFFTDPANGFHYDLRTAPATGSAEAISARPKTMQVYIAAIRAVASSRPPQPPWARP